MTSLQRIAIPLIIFLTALELLLPEEAHAFGKKFVEQKATANTPISHKITTPAAVVKPQVEAKPVAFRPVQPFKTVIKQVASPKVVAPKKVIAKKQPKIKTEPVAHEQATKALEPTEKPVTVASNTNQPTAGQQIGKHVDNGVDSVSGFFGKLKDSMSQPTTQNSCSTAQKAMSQC